MTETTQSANDTASANGPTDHRLSAEELKFWDEKGYVGPYTALTVDEMDEIRETVFAAYKRQSSVYGFITKRDRHLDCRAIFDAIAHRAIIDRCASILGDDVIIWRSTLFPKAPGGKEILWHQGRDFPGRRMLPAIDPPTNITCWMALTEANRENGCVQLLPGTHRQIIKFRDTEEGKGIFGRGVEIDVDDSNPAVMELKPGQFFLFTEATVHGSEANTSNTDRIGVATRITSASTKVYQNQTIDGQGFPLKNWHAVLVKGEDKHGYNKLGPPPEHDEYPVGALGQSIGRIRRKYYNKFYGVEV